MFNNKRNLTIVSYACILLFLFGCGNQNKELYIIQTNEPTEETTAIPSEKYITFETLEIETKVRELIDKPSGNITEQDVFKIMDLDLDHVEIKSFSDLVLFKNLKKLRLESSNITNLDGIESLTNLEILWLRDNEIYNIKPLMELTSLKELDIADNNVVDYSPIENLSNLVDLGIGDNNGNIGSLSFLKKLTKLESLYAPWCGITDISAISGMTQLTYLNLRNNNISNIGPLKKLKNLEYLELADNIIVDITALDGLPNSAEIFIDGNPIDKEQYKNYKSKIENDLYTVHVNKKIHKTMSEFDFAVQGYKDRQGSYIAKKVTISCQGKTLQEINFIEDELLGYPSSYDEEFGFVVEDMNFDGFKDIRIVQYVPAAPNISYLCWIWDKKLKQFKEDKDLESILSPEFDHKKELIYSFTRGSASEHYEETYQYIDGKLTLIRTVATGYVNDEDPDNPYYMEYKLMDGEWKLIKKKIIELEEIKIKSDDN